MNVLREWVKKLAFRHTPLGAPKYGYMLEPIQLAEIVNGLETVLSKQGRQGSVVEIGVARGMTSRFIVEHLVRQRYDVNFYCIDTFASFVESDIDHEVKQRGKSKSELVGFGYNDFDRWKANFKDFAFVHAIQADAGSFDFSKIAPICFCFLDVDLYLPTKKVLSSILGSLADEAIIVVDDVKDNNNWDGAYQAFVEFVAEHKSDSRISHRYVGNKCGVLHFRRQ